MHIGKERFIRWFIVGLPLLFYLWMAAQIPYTHDDWDWGLDVGIRQLVTANLNSRYVGNFIVVVLTRSVLLKTFVMGVVFWSVSVLAMKIGTKENAFCELICFCVSNFLILTMDKEIWRQTFGWVSGFSNFVVSALLVVIYYRIIEELFRQETVTERRISSYVLLLGFSVVIQLFIENVTVFMIAFGIFELVCSMIKKKDVRKYGIMLLGHVLGAIIMFSSNMYQTLISEGTAINGYRRFTFEQNDGFFEIIKSLLKVLAKIMIPNIWEKNWLICISVLLIMIVLMISKRKTHAIYYAGILMNLILVGYFIWAHINYDMFYEYHQETPVWHAVINLIFFVFIFIELCVCLWERKEMLMETIVLWFSAPGVVMPLVITTQNSGPRIYLTSNMILILFIIALLKLTLNSCEIHREKIILGICIPVVAVMMMFWGIIYYDIGIVRVERLQIMEKAEKEQKEEIHMPVFPHKEYLWNPNPVTPDREVFFHEFYGIDSSVKIIFEK